MDVKGAGSLEPQQRSTANDGVSHILGPFGKDSDLRRYGERIAARGGGKVAKKKAVVAVARKLAVLLHRLWQAGEVYQPLHQPVRPTTTNE